MLLKVQQVRLKFVKIIFCFTIAKYITALIRNNKKQKHGLKDLQFIAQQ